ncbi:thioredoxin-dependent thiol peroxidase, partial [bacterium]|nr:thioredoxin-dependent thiol peroxidase [bacterium]
MKPLKVGEKVSSFTVNDHLGNPHSLEDYTGSKVVVFFYPKASTPGCTAEACDLRDHYKELKDAGYVLLGVSADTEKKQKAFVDKFDFPFPLLADTEKKIIEAFGVWGPKKFMGKEYEGIHRMT